MSVPKSVRAWFVVHFAADMIVALPLLIWPQGFLSLLGWTHFDPLAARLVAAALFAIGGMSLIVREEDRNTFQVMILFKLLWSGAAIIGILVTIIQGYAAELPWIVLAVFTAFFALWTYYYILLRH
ncbi:hypothetical protein GF342_01460 [Candidatus Woesearchaeota archaeon]|nr:hypothetical protein [Candidatus Woesearchaeota archaeon]